MFAPHRKSDGNERPRLFLVDGSSYIYRAFYAIAHLSNSKGLPTNAVFGFTQMLLKVLKEHRPDYLAVVFDSKAPTFRSKIYKEYKANRPTMPQGLIPQIPYIRKIVEGYGIAALEMEGYEADDLIGTVAKKLEPEADVVIITGDKDILQLVSSRIHVYDTMKERKIGVQEVIERFGVRPEQVVEVMGLAGDAIDNIPGVPGIGEKTAVELIKNFGTIENLLNHLDELKQNRLKEKLEAHRELARLSRELVTIHTDAPVTPSLQDLSLATVNVGLLRELFKELEFHKLLKELPEEKTAPKTAYRLVVDREEFLAVLEELKRAGCFAIDLKTTSPHPMWADPVGISLAYNPGQAFYVPVGHHHPEAKDQLPLSWVLEELKPLLENGALKKVGQNLKYEWVALGRYGIQIRGIHCDTMIASYLLNPTKHSHDLNEIARDHLDRSVTDYKDVAGSGAKAVSFDRISPEKARDYSCEEADVTLQLSRILLPKLEAGGFQNLFAQVELPLLAVLAKMEMNGVRIDMDLLREYSKEIEIQLDQKIDQIYMLAGETFNINSSRQLGKILFEKLRLPVVKKTKTGYSTDVDVLTKLSLQHDLPMEILTYRNLSKLKSTYIDALPRLIHPKTGRVHTSYNQTVTATGRLSSSDPNLQNIPVRAEEGNRIRQAFVPDGGRRIVSADYSQIELRILAHLSQDETLIEAFERDEDIHTRTASEIFGTPIEKVTSSMRREAKVINFGIIYGMSAYGLSRQLGTDPKVAQAYIDEYFKNYPKVQAYIEASLAEARERGYVSTLLHRRRYVPEINSTTVAIRQASERMAINTPLQGTAADMIKIAMVRLQNRIEELNLSTKMIMQVHDELVFEVPEEEEPKVLPLVEAEMEGVMVLNVPLKVTIHSGRNWAEAH
ncbi:MAG: DNA polymerase I [Deltaproteobacteria bacterium RBG_13_53_10]|nr:MAG: DNA polymerase I [Deltaproteobacteria bacterium RBG_13_53_10]